MNFLMFSEVGKKINGLQRQFTMVEKVKPSWRRELEKLNRR